MVKELQTTAYRPTAQQGNFTDIYNSYVNYLDATPRTAEAYRRNIGQFVKWIQREGITQPTRSDVLAYRDELKARCKPATVNAYITALRLFFSWTSQTGLYPNICDHVKGAKIDTSHKKDALTADQAKDLINSIPTKTATGRRDKAIICLMLTGGLRDIEISRANLGDLEQIEDGGRLFIQGKGHDEKADYIKIVPDVKGILRDYLRSRTGSSEDTAPLFTSYANNSRGGRLTPRTVSAIVKSRLKNAGIDSNRITAHSLRHAAVTLALLGGLPLEEVQQFARHRNISTTQIYAHHLDRAKNRSAETIANSIF